MYVIAKVLLSLKYVLTFETNRQIKCGIISCYLINVNLTWWWNAQG